MAVKNSKKIPNKYKFLSLNVGDHVILDKRDYKVASTRNFAMRMFFYLSNIKRTKPGFSSFDITVEQGYEGNSQLIKVIRIS